MLCPHKTVSAGGDMSGLTRLIHEIHRRSLWQVLLVYLGASYAMAAPVVVDPPLRAHQATGPTRSPSTYKGDTGRPLAVRLPPKIASVTPLVACS